MNERTRNKASLLLLLLSGVGVASSDGLSLSARPREKRDSLATEAGGIKTREREVGGGRRTEKDQRLTHIPIHTHLGLVFREQQQHTLIACVCSLALALFVCPFPLPSLLSSPALCTTS